MVPIHCGLHWTVAIIDLKKETLSYFDSYHDENPEVLENLARYIADEADAQQLAPVHTKS